MVTDGEEAFKLAAENHFPRLRLFRDWGHLFKNAERQLKKLHVTDKGEVDGYLADLRNLFSAASKMDYLSSYNDILSTAGKWIDVRILIRLHCRFRISIRFFIFV